MINYNKSLEQAYIDMILRRDFNSFITVTLKQGLPVNSAAGTFRPLDDSECQRTAWYLRDRLNKKLVRKQAKQGYSLPFAAFLEGDGHIVRTHIHILSACPSNWSWDNYTDVVRCTASKLDWVYRHVDIRPIQPDTQGIVIGYCLKSGVQAFIAEASSI